MVPQMTAAALSPTKAEVPFRLAGGAQPLILISVSVNGRGPFDFILDTGAGTTLLTPTLAEHLKVAITGSKQGHTAGGAVDVKLASVDSITIGDLSRERIDVAIVDLSQLEGAVGAKIDGDLGHNFFGTLRLTIDYRRNLLRLDDPNRTEYVGAPPLTNVPARLAHPAKPLILVDTQVNGRGPFCFAIDTGTSTTVIADELASELQLKTTEAGNATTGGAALAVRAARIESLRVGHSQVGELNVMVGGFLPILSSIVGTKLDGVLGYDFLRNYKVVIDYPNSSFSLFAP
ncbi:MAG: aspartyl protease family protein [Chthoniobacterales bacterium]